MRFLLLLGMAGLAGCGIIGPRLDDFDCTAENSCRAGVVVDPQGVALITNTDKCARVQVENVGPFIVCNGRREMGPADSMAVGECRICEKQTH